jgi:hypothetical protein
MDPKWWYRAGIAIVVIAFIVLIARASMIAMRPDTAKIERAIDASKDSPPPPAPTAR